MSFQEEHDCWNLLFEFISKDEDNETPVIGFLDKYNEKFTNFKCKLKVFY